MKNYQYQHFFCSSFLQLLIKIKKSATVAHDCFQHWQIICIKSVPTHNHYKYSVVQRKKCVLFLRLKYQIFKLTFRSIIIVTMVEFAKYFPALIVYYETFNFNALQIDINFISSLRLIPFCHLKCRIILVFTLKIYFLNYKMQNIKSNYFSFVLGGMLSSFFTNG